METIDVMAEAKATELLIELYEYCGLAIDGVTPLKTEHAVIPYILDQAR